MATSSTIALEFADGTIGQVYCHSDGYLAYNGVILNEHWSDPFKLKQLIDNGQVSCLGIDIGEKIDFNSCMVYNDKNQAVQCRFYGRDRGETEVDAQYFRDFADYKTNGGFREYNYILRQVDGQPVWFVNGQTLESAFFTEVYGDGDE